MAPFQGADHWGLRSGGLRYAATTGYYLTAFQAETRPLPRSVLQATGLAKSDLIHYTFPLLFAYFLIPAENRF